VKREVKRGQGEREKYVDKRRQGEEVETRGKRASEYRE
jgi:hypothetical protein